MEKKQCKETISIRMCFVMKERYERLRIAVRRYCVFSFVASCHKFLEANSHSLVAAVSSEPT